MRQLIIMLLFVLALLCSCKSTKYIQVPVDRVHTEYIDRLKHDSIYIYDKDSIFIEHKGDTVFLNKYKLKYIYRDVYKRDTIAKVDTITKIQVVEKPVITNKLNQFQKILIATGSIALIILLVIGGYKIYKLFK